MMPVMRETGTRATLPASKYSIQYRENQNFEFKFEIVRLQHF